MQSRAQSLLEATANIALGMGIAFAGQLIVFPLVGLAVRLDQNVAITIAFTAVSLFRSYALRRFFNWLHTPKPNKYPGYFTSSDEEPPGEDIARQYRTRVQALPRKSH